MHPFTRMFTLIAALAVTTTTLSAPAAASAEPARSASATEACKLPGRTGWTDEGHDTNSQQFLRATGKLRAVMLFVDFPDAPAPSSDTDEYYNWLEPGTDWFRTASYGRLNMSIEPVKQWFRMPQESSTYGFDRGITFEQHEVYIKQAVTAADGAVDFSGYDLIYIVPPKNAAPIKFSPAWIDDRVDNPGVVADGHALRWGATFGQDMWRWGSKVLNHETSHTMGLPDLYAFTDPAGTRDWHRYVGGWDLMGDIAGAAPQLFAWHAWKFGWIDDAQVFCAEKRHATYRLTPIERAGGRKMVVIRTGETTAYVAESRRATGLDSTACSSGVVVYKVDSSTWTGYAPIQVMDSRVDVAPPTGCKPLDDGAYHKGEVFEDTVAGVRIRVLSSGPAGDVIDVRRS